LLKSHRSLGYAPRLLYPAKSLLTHTRAGWWRVRRPAAAPGVRILYYHRIADTDDELSVSPRRFAAQMEELARSGLRGVDTVEAALGGDNVIGLNFDDGYRDVAEHALPVLQRLGFRATVFIATGVTDGRARFHWYERQPALLGWEEIAALDRDGTLTFEPHTVTHPNLLALDDGEAEREIGGSKSELEERLERPAQVFCYPAGLFGARDRALVAAAGFRFAVSCEPGANTSDTDPLALRRIQVDRRDRLVAFRAKVGGGFDAPPPLRARWRRLRYGMESSRA
jgi:peptidoglycan/xylan/chitin deacetylase (PgdA/CDA1 family)